MTSSYYGVAFGLAFPLAIGFILGQLTPRYRIVLIPIGLLVPFVSPIVLCVVLSFIYSLAPRLPPPPTLSERFFGAVLLIPFMFVYGFVPSVLGFVAGEWIKPKSKVVDRVG